MNCYKSLVFKPILSSDSTWQIALNEVYLNVFTNDSLYYTVIKQQKKNITGSV